jgi:hypothetical protein
MCMKDMLLLTEARENIRGQKGQQIFFGAWHIECSLNNPFDLHLTLQPGSEQGKFAVVACVASMCTCKFPFRLKSFEQMWQMNSLVSMWELRMWAFNFPWSSKRRSQRWHWQFKSLGGFAKWVRKCFFNK